MIILQDIKLAFNGLSVLDIDYLELEDGVTYLIKGESGTGKTTLFNVISGLKLPDSGIVQVGDEFVHIMKEKDRDSFRAKNIGYIFQDFNLFDGFSALENVIVPLTFLNKSYVKNDKKDNKEVALEALKKVGLEKKASIKVNKLSGGEKQRVAIARAIVSSPKILLADEPTGNLDRRNSGEIMDLLISLAKENNSTMLVISHDLSMSDKFDKVLDIFDFNKKEDI